MIIFKELTFKNLLSFGEQPVVIDFRTSQTTLVTGENGVGKSTFLDALCLALYNKPFRKITRVQIPNSINKNKTLITLTFETNGREYEIKRGIKPNVFEIYEDGKQLEQTGSANDFQAHLEKNILQMNYTAFTQIVLLGKTSYVPFMRLPLGNRRALIEDLLGLNVFAWMNKVLKSKVSGIKEALQENDAAIETCKVRTESQERHVETFEENKQQTINRIIGQIEDLQEAVQNKKDAIPARKQLVEAKEKIVDEKVKDVDTEIKKREDAEKEYERVVAAREAIPDPDSDDDIKKQVKALQKRRDGLRDMRVKFRIKSETLEKDANFLRDNEDCPVCRQHIEPGFRAEHVAKKTGKIQEIDKAGEKVKADVISIGDSLEKLANDLEEVHQQHQRIVEADSLVKDARRMLSTHDRMIQHANEAEVTARQAVKDAEKFVTAGQADIEDAVSMVTRAQKQLMEAEALELDAAEKTKLKKYKTMQTKLEKKRAELVETSAYYTAIAGMLKDSGIKTQIIKKYLPVLNGLMNKFLNQMGFFIGFEFDEEFNETIGSTHRDKFTYESFSEGQKLRIDLAIMLTWREIAKMKSSLNTNLLIMDEVFDSSLDQSGVDAFVDIIPTLEDSNAWVVSHTPDKLVDKFDREVMFEFHDKFSVMRN